MGILDKKTRVMDFVITDHGRMMLSRGEFIPAYATFTDSAAVYEQSGSDTLRYFIEQPSVSQYDVITFQADDEHGHVAHGGIGLIIRDGLIISSSGGTSSIVTGSQFISESLGLMSMSLDSIRKNYLLSSNSSMFDGDEFMLSRSEMRFAMTDDSPFKKGDISSISINDAESMFQDRRLSHVENFKFLPPVNGHNASVANVGKPIGSYHSLGQGALDDASIRHMLSKSMHERVDFIETSRANNIVIQLFEISSGRMIKLNVIERIGAFDDKNATQKRLFFAGKLFRDDNGSYTYINVFDIVLD